MADMIPIPMTAAARDALVAAIVLCIMYAIIVGLRVIGRLRWGILGLDDILSVAACILTMTTIGMSTAVYTAGVGYDLDPKSPYFPTLYNNLEYILKNTFAFVGVYLWALAFMKLSQCCLYWRVFVTQLKWWIIWTSIIVLIWAIVLTFIAIFLCTPVEAQWSVDRKPEQCMDQILVLKTLIMTNVVTDLFIMLLPIWTVWQLNMKAAEKATVICCFGLGTGCCIIGIVRFVEMFTIDLQGNLTGTSLRTFMLCAIELCLAGFCTNLPMLRPYYRRWRNRHAPNGSSSGGGSRSMGKEVDGSGSRVPWTDRIIGGQRQQQNHQAWVELDATRDRSNTKSNDDGDSSVRALTKDSDGAGHGGIQMTTEWKVDRQ
ncbi:hypothetical protein MCOR27_010324 [Pyricularia oryzae]|uniref:Rhodopsin domain-containing protein n=5 Tax=Pyricularia TaxID=48558 RepID=A0ABQ8NWV7_PYRGI|nr:uncharacterized protein MGG_06624 [Pyricularia oryzae 70-15]ELQ42203.1 hypothetical protein OOU_Y34scaffold00224g17 [Pyricularia oryzae Y34]KAH8843681.1 hypothetical protein MCOR01_004472 [Pyricularia oryzae]KAI6302739.1 hypothetical protein MCOR33_002009 [Pyricularia grisea]EHA50584.1 hypothetical protein MGG_06624 [Pyricularia oryzae 70-15]KAH9431151.1 hypothetical protein MCOR02_008459 [Pyricularia oryzae]